jgi:hypothetical protein
MRKEPNKVPMSAQTFVAKLKADNGGSQPIEISDRYIYGKVDLAHLSLDVALIVTNCDFKQAVKFCNCTFMREFDSGDDTDFRTIYRKNLVCNGSAFWGGPGSGAFDARGTRCLEVPSSA